MGLFQEDAAAFVDVVKEVNSGSSWKCDDLDDNLMKEFAYGAAGDICPMAAVIGGITAQEVMKVGQQLCNLSLYLNILD